MRIRKNANSVYELMEISTVQAAEMLRVLLAGRGVPAWRIYQVLCEAGIPRAMALAEARQVPGYHEGRLRLAALGVRRPDRFLVGVRRAWALFRGVLKGGEDLALHEAAAQAGQGLGHLVSPREDVVQLQPPGSGAAAGVHLTGARARIEGEEDRLRRAGGLLEEVSRSVN